MVKLINRSIQSLFIFAQRTSIFYIFYVFSTYFYIFPICFYLEYILYIFYIFYFYIFTACFGTAVTDWGGMGRVAAETRDWAFETLGRAFDFFLGIQRLGRVFGKLGWFVLFFFGGGGGGGGGGGLGVCARPCVLERAFGVSEHFPDKIR